MARGMGLGPEAGTGARQCSPRAAVPGQAVGWHPEAGASGTFCFPQQKSVSRRKCAACKIVVHTPCIEQLEKVSVAVQAFLPLPLGLLKPSRHSYTGLCTRVFTSHKQHRPGVPQYVQW